MFKSLSSRHFSNPNPEERQLNSHGCVTSPEPESGFKLPHPALIFSKLRPSKELPSWGKQYHPVDEFVTKAGSTKWQPLLGQITGTSSNREDNSWFMRAILDKEEADSRLLGTKRQFGEIDKNFE